MDPLPAPQPSPTIVTPAPGTQVIPVVQKIIFEHPRRSRWIAWLLALGLAVSLFFNFNLQKRYQKYFQPEGKLTESYHSLSRESDNKIAIIRVDGAIYETDGYIKKQIEQVAADDDVKAVVLRIDSPGGTVVASDYLYHRLCELTDPSKRKLPMIVSMGGLAASGGYYLAMAVGDRENAIYAEPTTWCGSIGVVIPHYNLSGFMEEHKIADDSITSHPLKTIGSFTEPMTEQERAILQGLVDDGFRRFKEVVASGRPALRADPALLEKVATGQVFATNEAIENKLVDKEGFLEDAIDAAAEAAGLDPREVRCVQYEQPKAALDELLGATTQLGRNEMERLAELATPRSYYMWSLLPGWEALTSRRD